MSFMWIFYLFLPAACGMVIHRVFHVVNVVVLVPKSNRYDYDLKWFWDENMFSYCRPLLTKEILPDISGQSRSSRSELTFIPERYAQCHIFFFVLLFSPILSSAWDIAHDRSKEFHWKFLSTSGCKNDLIAKSSPEIP